MFAAPTMVKRLVGAAQARGETGEGLKTMIYGGGPMYLEDIKTALAVHGPALRPDLRPGRIADDHHRIVAGPARRGRSSALRRAAGVGGNGAERGGDCGSPTRTGGRARRASVGEIEVQGRRR